MLFIIRLDLKVKSIIMTRSNVISRQDRIRDREDSGCESICSLKYHSQYAKQELRGLRVKIETTKFMVQDLGKALLVASWSEGQRREKPKQRSIKAYKNLKDRINKKLESKYMCVCRGERSQPMRGQIGTYDRAHASRPDRLHSLSIMQSD